MGAEALTKNQWTIRANRGRYYFGINKLRSRHTDNLFLAADREHATLFPSFLCFDSLGSRSRPNQDSLLHVNYNIKPVLITQIGNDNILVFGLRHVGIYLFLGNDFDHAKLILDTITLMLAYTMNFLAACASAGTFIKMWKQFCTVFNTFLVCGLIVEKIVCL